MLVHSMPLPILSVITIAAAQGTCVYVEPGAEECPYDHSYGEQAGMPIAAILVTNRTNNSKGVYRHWLYPYHLPLKRPSNFSVSITDA